MESVPEELLHGPFLVREALALGVSVQMLRGRRFRAPWTGVRIPAQLPDDLRTRSTALSLLIPEAAFSHATAAELLGLWMPHHWHDPTLHISVNGSHPRRTGVVTHRTTWEPDDVHERRGLRLTSPARTLCDLAAANWNVTDLVVVADAVQSRGLATKADLGARIAAWPPAPGAHLLRQVAALTRPGSDSAMETRLRLKLAAARLPEPLVNHVVKDSNGAYVHKPDLSWPEHKVAADYDGAHHLTDVERRRRMDIGRQEAMAEAGWLLKVLTATDVLQHPERAVAKVRLALREHGARV